MCPVDRSVCPGLAAVVAEIVGIGDLSALRLMRLDHPVGDVVALGVADRLVDRRDGVAGIRNEVERPYV